MLMENYHLRDLPLARLLQLASPTLPVGAYSYSQGLESAIEAGIVHDAASAQSWIADVLELSIARMEAPLLLRLQCAWAVRDFAAVEYWNALFLASRESAELRAETVQMGYSLTRLLHELGEPGAPDPSAFSQLQHIDEPAFPTAYACAAAQWRIEPAAALMAYLRVFSVVRLFAPRLPRHSRTRGTARSSFIGMPGTTRYWRYSLGCSRLWRLLRRRCAIKTNSSTKNKARPNRRADTTCLVRACFYSHCA